MRVTLEKSHASSARSASAMRARSEGSACRWPWMISDSAVGASFNFSARSTCVNRRAAIVTFKFSNMRTPRKATEDSLRTVASQT